MVGRAEIRPTTAKVGLTTPGNKVSALIYCPGLSKNGRRHAAPPSRGAEGAERALEHKIERHLPQQPAQVAAAVVEGHKVAGFGVEQHVARFQNFQAQS